MARVSNNIITQGLSGTIGGTLVFRQVGGRTIVSAAPRESEKAPTAGQLAQRERFQQAALYAKAELSDPAGKAEYEAGRPEDGSASAYAIAVADFIQAPDIHTIDLSNYQGRVGDTIRVRVTDDFKVVGVTVRIENSDGSVVEDGAAVQQQNGPDWVFTATQANATLVGDKITVRATDKPHNTTTETRTL
ncbi:hypothetical protein F0P96_16740 [Hymenobacter busanensis]|uniref:Uncharacterized protein n=1 Tax=Hymenobacter busanensis TaxID=2607656 RepID=A0A7L4ZSX9_9BACT|nr:hypothetical protein [Hymenobacter busanensis]KAA9327624.1 hypothetical protein F0P96_16740 [Hymenobacter busanensis]QHJ06037.1 hypothetical protein GUY19_01495 [Hymenobacter busanensis]